MLWLLGGRKVFCKIVFWFCECGDSIYQFFSCIKIPCHFSLLVSIIMPHLVGQKVTPLPNLYFCILWNKKNIPVKMSPTSSKLNKPFPNESNTSYFAPKMLRLRNSKTGIWIQILISPLYLASKSGQKIFQKSFSSSLSPPPFLINADGPSQ